MPVFGRGVSGARTLGVGDVEPDIISAGSDATGLLCGIAWLSWGGRFAIGRSTSRDVVGSRTTSQGKSAPAAALSGLGRWHGRSANLR